mmetsp:Transcript_28439/g.67074  ORF Transcript_28439/g.67074 Transcript_28439/m.67074 type:complete len:220 (-) Transcript_28439:15-674(-)
MLPSAQMACSCSSCTSLFVRRSKCTKIGMAPLSITTRVCSDVPDETLVSAHAASKTSVGLSYDCRNWTSRGTTPAAMTSAMGGLRSIESSLRKRVVASSCCCGSADCSSATSSGRFSSFALRVWSGSVPTLEEAWPLELPASREGARRFCRLSSFFSLRICTLVASRRRRLSSWSMPFLNCCFRSSCFRIIALRSHSRAHCRAPPSYDFTPAGRARRDA